MAPVDGIFSPPKVLHLDRSPELEQVIHNVQRTGKPAQH